jgi:type II secretory pathway component GspD/PulD (secretin)
MAAAVGAQQPSARPPQPPSTPRSTQMPTLPLTQLAERALAADLDNRAFTLTFAQPVPIKDLLLLLVRGTSLSVIPDPTIAGSFIGELKNVTVRRALGLVLPPLGLDFAVNGGFVRVFKRQPETRLFDINFIATERTGEAMVADGTAGATFARVVATTSGDLFADLTKGVQALLSESATFNVDRKASLLQVTDFPERLDRVALYLDAVTDRAHRQVQIDARVIEVELNEAHMSGLDWTPLSQTRNASKLAAALAEQGKVSVLANPRLLVLNNEPAIVRAVTQTGGKDELRQASEAVTISVTAQIAPDRIVLLSLSPIVSARAEPAGNDARGPSALREAETIARVADGETIVFAGFPRNREISERKNTGIKGGWFGRSTLVTKQRIELVVLLTPTIVTSIPPG